MEKLLTLALSLLMIMSVCLTGAIAEEGSVVIENNGRTTTYNSVPERVVVLSYGKHLRYIRVGFIFHRDHILIGIALIGHRTAVGLDVHDIRP